MGQLLDAHERAFEYQVCFEGCADTLESLFGSVPMPPSGMRKRLWEYVKRHRLAAKG